MVPVADWEGETFVGGVEPAGEAPVKVDVEVDDKALAQRAVLTFSISTEYIIGHGSQWLRTVNTHSVYPEQNSLISTSMV
jgi:hypothetical protein